MLLLVTRRTSQYLVHHDHGCTLQTPRQHAVTICMEVTVWRSSMRAPAQANMHQSPPVASMNESTWKTAAQPGSLST